MFVHARDIVVATIRIELSKNEIFIRITIKTKRNIDTGRFCTLVIPFVHAEGPGIPLLALENDR